MGVSMLEGSALIAGPEGAHLQRQRWSGDPAPGSALVRVFCAGICRTDLYAAEGRLPVAQGRVLGHEFSGRVEAVGPGCQVEPGSFVTANPLLPCGQCEGCRRGAACLAPRMLGCDVDGVFASHVVLPAAALHPLPRHWSSGRGAFVEPAAAALAVLRAPLPREGRGALLGQSRIADLTLRALRHAGFSGVEACTNGETLEGCAYDFVVETSADAVTLRACVRALRPGGLLVLKSRPPEPVPLDVAAAVRKELRLHAVNYAPFPEAIAWLDGGAADDLLGDVYPLARFAEAFTAARRSESKKLFLAPGANEG